MGNSSNSQNQRKNSQNGAKNRRNRRNNAKNRQNRANSVAVNNNSTNSANTTQKPYNNSRNSYAGEKNTTPSGNTRIIAEESENTSKNASASASKNHNTNTRTNTENTAKKSGTVEISTLSEGSTAENAPVERSSHRNRRHRKHVDFDSIVDETEALDNNHTNAHITTNTANSRSNRSDRRRKSGQNHAQNGENEEKSAKTGWSEDEMSVILDSTTMGAIKRNNALFFWEIDGLLKSNGTQHSWVYLKNNPPKLTFKRPKEQPFTIFLGKEEVNQLAPALEAVRKAYNAVPIQEKKKEKWTLHNFANIFKNKFYENPGLMVAKIAAIVVMIGIAVFALCL